MYHQYMHGSFSPIVQSSKSSGSNCTSQNENIKQKSTHAAFKGGLSGLLSGLEKPELLSKFDAGDILLILIILFLFREGDNLELVITLGLMLLFGLDDTHSAS